MLPFGLQRRVTTELFKDANTLLPNVFLHTFIKCPLGCLKRYSKERLFRTIHSNITISISLCLLLLQEISGISSSLYIGHIDSLLSKSKLFVTSSYRSYYIKFRIFSKSTHIYRCDPTQCSIPSFLAQILRIHSLV